MLPAHRVQDALELRVCRHGFRALHSAVVGRPAVSGQGFTNARANGARPPSSCRCPGQATPQNAPPQLPCRKPGPLYPPLAAPDPPRAKGPPFCATAFASFFTTVRSRKMEGPAPSRVGTRDWLFCRPDHTQRPQFAHPSSLNVRGWVHELMAGWLRGVLLGLLVLLAPVASAPPAGVVDLASVDAIEDAVASSNALLIAFLSEGCGERARAQAARRAEC